MGKLRTLALIGGSAAIGFGLLVRKLNKDIEKADRRLSETIDRLHTAEQKIQKSSVSENNEKE